MSKLGARVGIAVGVVAVALVAACGALFAIAGAGAGLVALLPRPEAPVEGPEVLRDEDYRIELRRPGPGWLLLDAETTVGFDPVALVGARSHDGGFALVYASISAAQDDAALDEAIVSAIGETLEPSGDATSCALAGRPARRRHFTAHVGEMRLEYEIAYLAHQGHLYRVVVWWNMDSGRPVDPQPVFDAFSLLPGEVRARRVGAVTQDVRGRAWEYRDRVLSRADTGLRIDASDPFALMPEGDRELAAPFSDAGLVLASEVGMLVEMTRVGAPELAARRALLEGEEAEETSELALAGVVARCTPVQLDDLTRRVCTAALPAHTLVIDAWAPSAAVLDQALAQLGPRITVLDEPTRAALAAELSADPPHARAAGLDWSIRGDTYRDFAMAFTYERASQEVELVASATEAARAESRLWLARRDEGVFGRVDVELDHTVALPTAHQRWMESLSEGNPVEACSFQTAGLCARTQLGDEGDARQLVLVSARSRAATLHFLLWYDDVRRASAESALEAMALGLGLREIAPAHTEHGVFVAERLGFSLRSPWPDRSVEESTPERLAGTLTVVSVEDTMRGSVVVLALSSPEGPGASPLAHVLLDETMHRLAPGAVWSEEEETLVSGHAARVRRAARMGMVHSAYVIPIDRTVYALILSAPRRASAPELERLRDSLTILR